MSVTRPDHMRDQLARTFSAFGIGRMQWREFPSAQSYPPRVTMFRQGEPPDGVFLLEQGLVKLIRVEPDGREIILGLRAAGWMVGAAAAIIDCPHVVTAVTVCTSQLSRISATTFRELLKTMSSLSWHLHEMLSREVEEGLTHVAELNALPARDRLEAFFERLAGALQPDHDRDEVRLEIPLRQWEIAQLIGVTAPYLCELTRELESLGLVRRERESIVLCRRRSGEPNPT